MNGIHSETNYNQYRWHTNWMRLQYQRGMLYYRQSNASDTAARKEEKGASSASWLLPARGEDTEVRPRGRCVCVCVCVRGRSKFELAGLSARQRNRSRTTPDDRDADRLIVQACPTRDRDVRIASTGRVPRQLGKGSRLSYYPRWSCTSQAL